MRRDLSLADDPLDATGLGLDVILRTAAFDGKRSHDHVHLSHGTIFEPIRPKSYFLAGLILCAGILALRLSAAPGQWATAVAQCVFLGSSADLNGFNRGDGFLRSNLRPLLAALVPAMHPTSRRGRWVRGAGSARGQLALDR
jgi:hypothetical protein